MLGPEVDAFSVPPYLTAPFPAYVSFWSALARHDMIEQVPRLIYVASPGRTRRITTTIGTYSVHHLAPELFGGYVGSASSGYLASPEKALFDVVYLRAARGGRVMLPEIELPDGFRADELEKWIARVARPRLRTLVARGIELVLTNAASPT
jgi:predicted transcriptional regulator of viral defense system